MAKAFISLVRCATRSDNGDTLPIVSRIIASADHETTAVSSAAPASLNPPENSAGWALWCITPRLGPVYVSKDATASAANSIRVEAGQTAYIGVEQNTDRLALVDAPTT
jgi:hypothetical protein